MDRRLVEKLKEYDNSDTVIISNAGANVSGLRNTIARLLQKNSFAEIRILTHDDCGAMRLVSEHLFEMRRAAPNIYVHLVRQFENRAHEAVELDHVNEIVQKERMEEMARGTRVYSEMVKLHTLKIPAEMMKQKEATYRLIVSKPVYGGYKSFFNSVSGEKKYSTYALLGYGQDVINDIEIAVSRLEVIEIFFLIQDACERRVMEKYRDLIKTSIHRSEIALGFEIRTSIVENFQNL